MLVPTIDNAIFADTVQGLSDVLEPLGTAVILAQSRYDAAREDRALAALLARRPDAIVMVGSPATEDGARLLRGARIPVVETWDLPPAPIDAAAGFDNRAAGAAVAAHLLSRGHRAMAFVGGDDPRAGRRWMGFAETLAAAGAPAPQRVMVRRSASDAAGLAAGLAGLDAVFAANDAHAIGLLSGLRAAGRRVAVVGLGDLEMGRLITRR